MRQVLIASLQLLDVGLVHQGVVHVPHGVPVPHLKVGLQNLDLLFGLHGELAPELAECLELVNELVDNLPEPLVGQLEVDRGVSGLDIVEELAVVVAALGPLLDRGAALNPGVDVLEVEFPAEVQEDGVVIDVGRHVLGLGPGQGLEELVRQLP